MRPWNLIETNYGDLKQREVEVAVIPFGATEPHNLHLPYGTDVFEGTIIGEKICEAAFAEGAKVLLLPTVPYGTETNMKQFPFAMNLNPSTILTIIKDLVQSCVDSGVRKVVLLNSHGGNDLKPFLRELADKTEAHLFLIEWYKAIGDVYFDICEEREDHAGEAETSLGLAYFPTLIRTTDDGQLAADPGATTKSRFEALNQGWVSISRPWHLLTTNSGSGNPHKATKEKGEQLMKVMVDRFAPFLVELSQATLDDQFPFAKPGA